MIAIGFALFVICLIWSWGWYIAKPFSYTYDQGFSRILAAGVVTGLLLLILGIARWLWEHT